NETRFFDQPPPGPRRRYGRIVGWARTNPLGSLYVFHKGRTRIIVSCPGLVPCFCPDFFQAGPDVDWAGERTLKKSSCETLRSRTGYKNPDNVPAGPVHGLNSGGGRDFYATQHHGWPDRIARPSQCGRGSRWGSADVLQGRRPNPSEELPGLPPAGP